MNNFVEVFKYQFLFLCLIMVCLQTKQFKTILSDLALKHIHFCFSIMKFSLSNGFVFKHCFKKRSVH
jgi:hypothetical protein